MFVISHFVKSRYGPAEEFLYFSISCTLPCPWCLALSSFLPLLRFSPHPAVSLWGASAWHRQSLRPRAASQRLDSPVWCISAEAQPASLHTLINVPTTYQLNSHKQSLPTEAQTQTQDCLLCSVLLGAPVACTLYSNSAKVAWPQRQTATKQTFI